MLHSPLFAVLALAVAAAGAPPKGSNPLLNFQKRHEPTCDIGSAPPTVKAPRENVWAGITPEDNAAVWALLHSVESGLNLTDPDSAALTDNYVFWVDTLPTNKTDVLPYIEDAHAPKPPKYARAIIFRGAIQEPDSQEFMIGPLPVGPETKVEPLDYMYVQRRARRQRAVQRTLL